MTDLQFKLTDEIWEDMVTLEGAPISAIVVWDHSLVDDSFETPIGDNNRVFVDVDLYLANQTKLELYGASVAIGEESDPITGLDEIGEALAAHTRRGAFVDEVAAGEEDMLVLMIVNEKKESLLLAVTAWLEDVWETLPEEPVGG